jgi:hypothetical protein
LSVPSSLLVATRKGLFQYRRRGKGSWIAREPSFLGVPISATLHDPRDGTVYAALDHGHFGTKLHRRGGDGKWEEIATPKYPPRAKGTKSEDAFGRPLSSTLKMIWILEIDPRRDGSLWCGTLPGGLFHSRDRGATWEIVRGLWNRPERKQWFGGGYNDPGIHSICVDPRDAQRVTVGVSSGGVWRTVDGGATWEQTAHGMRQDYAPPEKAYDPQSQDVHRVVQCRAAPDRLWAQHHNGIFKKPAQGKWQEVHAKAPSRFGFACAVDPNDPEVAWFVPAVKDECRVPVDGRLVVTRTRDGGASFEVLKQGLPKETVWDLVYRHGLDVSADGRMLAMGSTTGGLWVSEDGGRGWSELSSHLPPTYGVRIAAD